MSKQPTNWAIRLFVIIGGLFLIFIAVGSWLPNSCPLVRRWSIGCPAPRVVVPETSDEKEVARVAHQDIPGNLAQFSVKSQDFRGTTAVHFLYRADLAKQEAYLEIQKATGMTPLALITHPLLYNLTWPRISTTEPPVSLYQRSPQYDTIDQIKAQLPAKSQLVADKIIARTWGLTPDQYIDIDSLTSLDGVQFILTSYAPPTKDGTWQVYDQTFDVQDALVSADNLLQWQIYAPIVANRSEPFRLAPVHIDYKRIQP